MKSQSLKLFAIAFVLGLVTIFAAGSASAQTKSSFETSFDFHVGKDKLSAGKYELQKLDNGKFWLRNLETKKSRIVYFEIAERNNDSSEAAQRVTFNRYGETYFLRSLFEGEKTDGRQIIESSYEKQIRKGAAGRENQLAGDKAKPEKVSVNLSK
jgi:hypothetical protein